MTCLFICSIKSHSMTYDISGQSNQRNDMTDIPTTTFPLPEYFAMQYDRTHNSRQHYSRSPMFPSFGSSDASDDSGSFEIILGRGTTCESQDTHEQSDSSSDLNETPIYLNPLLACVSAIEHTVSFKRFDVNWKNLVMPACFPIFTETLPSIEAILRDYVDYKDVIFPELIREQLIQKELLAGSLSSHHQVYNDMVGLRLSRGFQLVVGDNFDSLMRCNEMLSEQTHPAVVDTKVLTIGRSVHVLQLMKCDEHSDGYKIIRVEFRPRTRLRNPPIVYTYRYWPCFKEHEGFYGNQCIFRYDEKLNIKWSELDNYVCVQNNTEEADFCPNMRYWRIKLALLPTPNQRSNDAELCQDDLGRRQCFVLFLKNLNKLKRVAPAHMLNDSATGQNESQLMSTNRSKVIAAMKKYLLLFLIIITRYLCLTITLESFPRTFISGEAVWWCLENVKDLNDERESIAFLQSLLSDKIILHTSRECTFYHGFYLYYFPSDTTRDFRGKPRSFCEVRFFDTPTDPHSLPCAIPEKPNIAFVNVEADPSGQSDKSEWASATYPLYYHPRASFELSLCWLVSTGMLLCDLIGLWTRKAVNYNFNFLPVPFSPWCEFQPNEAWVKCERAFEKSAYSVPAEIFLPSSLHLGCLNCPTRLSMNLQFLEEDEEFIKLHVHTKLKLLERFQKRVLIEFGFLVNQCVIDEPNGFYHYIHWTGTGLVFPDNYSDGEVLMRFGFLWMSNLRSSRKWKTVLSNTSGCTVNDSTDQPINELIHSINSVFDRFKQYCANLQSVSLQYEWYRFWCENSQRELLCCF
ncbi:hypothetical protein ACOME3_007234 [Neoechinorhynchus agilis]